MFLLPSSDHLMQLGNLCFSRELWWRKKHVKLKINIVIHCNSL